MSDVLLFFKKRIQNFLFLENESEILYTLLMIYKNANDYRKDIKVKNVFSYNYFENNPLVDSTLFHINSGGYGFIFRINEDYCAKITLDNDNNLDWFVPKTLNTMLKKKGLDIFSNFLNTPICMYKDKFFYGLFQSYTINCLIYYLIDYIDSNKKNKIDASIIVHQLEEIQHFNIKLMFNKIFIDSTNASLNAKLFSKIFTEIYKNTKYPVVIYNHFIRFVDLFTKIIKDKSFFEFTLKNKNGETITEKMIKDVNGTTLRQDIIDKIIKINPDLKHFIGNLFIENLAFGNFENVYMYKNKIVPAGKHKRAKYNEKYLKLCLSQILISIYIFNKECNFIHNDLKPDNILVFKCEEELLLTVGNNKFLFKEDYIFKINDFDFSKIPGLNNNIIKNSPLEKITNIFGDIHFLFATMFSSTAYIKKFFNIYEELYHNLIKNRCKECDNNYKKKDKNTFFKFHTSGSKIELELIETFIDKSFIFNNWRI